MRLFLLLRKKLNSIFKYALHDDTLPLKSLERASSICTYCISLVKMAVYREAILKKIPYIALGGHQDKSI